MVCWQVVLNRARNRKTLKKQTFRKSYFRCSGYVRIMRQIAPKLAVKHTEPVGRQLYNTLIIRAIYKWTW